MILRLMTLAVALVAPLSLAVVRKIRIPGTTESGFGAVTWDGQVLINEVLPSPSSGPEWVELYNDGQTAANLQLYPLVIGGSSVVLTTEMVTTPIGPASLLVTMGESKR